MAFLAAFAALLTLLSAPFPASAGPVRIVAAENFYGDVARQIGGDLVSVTSVMTNPNQDPHVFELTASVARAVSDARIVISSGAGYDPWMDRLLRATSSSGRRAIDVASLVGRKPGDDPHIWYDPATMLALADSLTDALSAADPAHAGIYAGRKTVFVQSLAPVRAAIAALRRAHGGTEVTATEPVFGYVFALLGLHVRNEAFQTAVMNDTEPSAAGIAAFEAGLKAHDVKLLVYNSQVVDPMAQRMRRIAHNSGIPVVAVTETEPPGVDYQHWMLGEIAQVAASLGGAP
jgi:zinc/manganese transport system substrate-binding protein